jgi:uncharacterized membrane-anchored protein YhcB (DUF1043 family)
MSPNDANKRRARGKGEQYKLNESEVAEHFQETAALIDTIA